MGLVLIAGVADALKGITVRAPAPAAACHTSLGPRNPLLAGISIEELKAELAKRDLPCQPAPAPSPSGPTPAPGPAPPMAVCSTVDGTAASSVYPCVCTGGPPAPPAPAPPPGAAPAAAPEPVVCEDESRHCLAGECVHPACTHTDGTKPSEHYPCTCLAGGPSPAPAPGPSGPSTCSDDSKNCKSGLCVDPPDNFADELVDQANVDFGMLDTNKDGCISDAEMTDELKEQVVSFKKGAAGERGYYWQEKQVQDGLKALTKEMDARASDIDKDKNGCVDEDEYKKIQKAHNDCNAQFVMMDTNGDGKVSRQEAANFVSHHMDHADISYGKQRAIFEAADTNKDNFLQEKEFCQAGKAFKGDGNGKF